MKNNGITLIALIVTIIVLIILSAVSVSLITSDNSAINSTVNTKFNSQIAEIKEKIEIAKVELKNIDGPLYLNTDEVNEIVNIPLFKDKIGVSNDTLYYLVKDTTSEDAKKMKESGFEPINMSIDEFKYYIELNYLQYRISSSNEKIGRELGTSQFNSSISIGTNIYSNGWYLVGNYSEEEKNNQTYNSDFEKLKLKDTTHSPYLVNYNENLVLSIEGMDMYSTAIMVHSFNDIDLSALGSSFVYVDSSAQRTEDYFGTLYSTSLYTGPVFNKKADYTDNSGHLVYDSDGALLLDNDNAIPVLEIDQRYTLNNTYSVSITFSGNLSQYNKSDAYAKTILAISGDSGQYCSWLGVYNNYLHVYSFRKNNPMQNTARETQSKGAASINISSYANKIINLQVTAVRNGKTNVYINGTKISTFDSGDVNLPYKYLTLGDLRVGRNLKFEGKIYDFTLFGTELTDEQIQNNYKKSAAYNNN